MRWDQRLCSSLLPTINLISTVRSSGRLSKLRRDYESTWISGASASSSCFWTIQSTNRSNYFLRRFFSDTQSWKDFPIPFHLHTLCPKTNHFFLLLNMQEVS